MPAIDNIFKDIEAKMLGMAWEKKREGQLAALGESLFPHIKTHGLNLAFGRGKKGYAVALKPSQFDAKATVRDRIGFKKVETEMPFFREAMSMREKEMMDLYQASNSTNKAFYDFVIAGIYDDRIAFIDSAMVQAERMRMQLLQTGEIRITDNRVDYTYDYEFDAANKLTKTGNECWNQPETSDPFNDIQAIKNTMRPKADITRAIMSPKTFQWMIQSKSLSAGLKAFMPNNAQPTESDYKGYLRSRLGMSFALTDNRYCLELGGTDYPYWTDGVVTFLPDGILGHTHWGTTPEELARMNGIISESRASVEVVDRGIAITTYTEEHPVNRIMEVACIMLPSFEGMDKVFIAKVF